MNPVKLRQASFSSCDAAPHIISYLFDKMADASTPGDAFLAGCLSPWPTGGSPASLIKNSSVLGAAPSATLGKGPPVAPGKIPPAKLGKAPLAKKGPPVKLGIQLSRTANTTVKNT